MSSSCICTTNRLNGSGGDGINVYETSSKRAHYYENVVDHPLNHLRVQRDSRKDLRVRDPTVILDSNQTTNSRIYDIKFWGDRKPDEYGTKRFSITTKTDLRFLHERSMKTPVKPMKFYANATAEHYSIPEKNRAPLSMLRKSPIESSSCPIKALGRDEFPSVPTNSASFAKHLDILVSSSQLAHTRFTVDQQNGVARKDIQTFYDAKGTPKCRGFGPKRSVPIGPYFHRDKTEPDRIRTRSFCRIPYSGKTSEYKARFDTPAADSLAIRSVVEDRDHEIHFPTIFPASPIDLLSTPAMYCTEYCHVGTGWPVRASVDLGKVRGTF